MTISIHFVHKLQKLCTIWRDKSVARGRAETCPPLLSPEFFFHGAINPFHTGIFIKHNLSLSFTFFKLVHAFSHPLCFSLTNSQQLLFQLFFQFVFMEILIKKMSLSTLMQNCLILAIFLLIKLINLTFVLINTVIKNINRMNSFLKKAILSIQ